MGFAIELRNGRVVATTLTCDLCGLPIEGDVTVDRSGYNDQYFHAGSCASDQPVAESARGRGKARIEAQTADVVATVGALYGHADDHQHDDEDHHE